MRVVLVLMCMCIAFVCVYCCYVIVAMLLLLCCCCYVVVAMLWHVYIVQYGAEYVYAIINQIKSKSMSSINDR